MINQLFISVHRTRTNHIWGPMRLAFPLNTLKSNQIVNCETCKQHKSKQEISVKDVLGLMVNRYAQ